VTTAGVRIVVVRHGETDWSASGRHTSHTDLPLNGDGRALAAALADRLNDMSFALVLCSPLRRARETCELAGFGDQAASCEDLHEWDYGDYEGLTTPEIRAQRPDWSLWRDGCPAGERPEQVAVRANRVLNRAGTASGDVLIFAHGHILRVLAARWIELGPGAGARFALGAGAIGVLGHERETAVIERWNAPAP
jgi:broad specificity phosphatase PhoE